MTEDETRVLTPTPVLSPTRKLLLFAAAVLVLEGIVMLAGPSPNLTPYVLVLVPAASALGIAAVDGRRGVATLIRRAGVWRVRPRWYAAAIGIPVLEKVVVDVAGVALGATTPERLSHALTLSALLIPLVVLVPALIEELGWRGFGVQNAAEAGHSPIWAALTVGVVFLALHVPLYMPGQLYGDLPFWPLPMILLSMSVLLTWVYLETGSVLLAGLMHAAFNGTVPLTWGLDPSWVWPTRALVLTAVAAAVVILSSKPWSIRRT